MGVKISKCYSYSFDCFLTKRFLNVPCTNPHKTYFLNFEISNLNLKRLKFNVPNTEENGKLLIYWKWPAIEQNRVKFQTGRVV